MIATAFEVVVIFVVAELAPKTWAVQHTERAALLAAPVISPARAFPPLRLGHPGSDRSSNWLLPGKGIKDGPYTSDEMLLAMADRRPRRT